MTSAVFVHNLNFFYDKKQALFDINLSIHKGQVTALIGPSGCGKSTFLRCLNRMNDLIEKTFSTGSITVLGENIFSPDCDVVSLRKKVGMIFQRSNPFPKSIFENVAFGPRIHGITHKSELAHIVETSLKRADLWEEVKERLNSSALSLSGGQQQRLCIARALAVKPKVLLMDEPASALDPRSSAKIEALIHELRGEYTIIIVTHSMQQAARVSDSTAFFYEGHLVELGETNEVFSSPKETKTRDFVCGTFG